MLQKWILVFASDLSACPLKKIVCMLEKALNKEFGWQEFENFDLPVPELLDFREVK